MDPLALVKPLWLAIAIDYCLNLIFYKITLADFNIPVAIMCLVYMLPDVRTKPDSNKVIFFTEVN